MLDSRKKEFTYTLKIPITYLTNNEATNKAIISKLVLRAPSNQDSEIKGELRQLVVQALMKVDSTQNLSVEESKKTINAAKIETAELKVMILLKIMNGSEPIGKYKKLFIELLSRNRCCLLEGKYEPTEFNIKSIDDDELEEIMGEYFANFIVPSWMKQQFMK